MATMTTFRLALNWIGGSVLREPTPYRSKGLESTMLKDATSLKNRVTGGCLRKTLMVVTLFAVAALTLACGSLTAVELAEKWVNDNVDAVGETIASVVIRDNALLRELGGEYIEDRIHGVVKWTFSPAQIVDGSLQEVAATAYVPFEAGTGLASGCARVQLPYRFLIDEANQAVLEAEPDILGANVEWDTNLIGSAACE